MVHSSTFKSQTCFKSNVMETRNYIYEHNILSLLNTQSKQTKDKLLFVTEGFFSHEISTLKETSSKRDQAGNDWVPLSFSNLIKFPELRVRRSPDCQHESLSIFASTVVLQTSSSRFWEAVSRRELWNFIDGLSLSSFFFD